MGRPYCAECRSAGVLKLSLGQRWISTWPATLRFPRQGSQRPRCQPIVNRIAEHCRRTAAIVQPSR